MRHADRKLEFDRFSICDQVGGLSETAESMDYKASGVDIDAGNEVVRRISGTRPRHVHTGVLSDIGSFGGLFHLGAGAASDPVLVASADGVGTKLRVAFMTGSTARSASISSTTASTTSWCRAPCRSSFSTTSPPAGSSPTSPCRSSRGWPTPAASNGCALLGGETAEMPGFYADGEYDVAGFIVGAVARDQLIDGERIAPGDVLIGLPSSGLHTNGYSLARRIAFEVAGLDVDGRRCRSSEATDRRRAARAAPLVPAGDPAAARAGVIKGMAHITGGGITDNLPRVLPPGTAAVVDRSTWRVPPIFEWLQQAGEVPDDDMLRTFNMGIGLIIAVGAGRCRVGHAGSLAMPARVRPLSARSSGAIAACGTANGAARAARHRSRMTAARRLAC